MKGTGRFPGSILSWILIKAGRTDGRGNRECWVISERGEIERDAGTRSLWLMLCLPVTLKTHIRTHISWAGTQIAVSFLYTLTQGKLREMSITVCHNKLLPVHNREALQVKYSSALKAYEDKKHDNVSWNPTSWADVIQTWSRVRRTCFMIMHRWDFVQGPSGDIVRSESVYFTVSSVSDREKNRDREECGVVAPSAG